jgi:AraC family transcriptional regulator
MSAQPDDITLEQGGHDRPDVLYAARSPGESGIELARLRFPDGALVTGCASRHMLVFHLGRGWGRVDPIEPVEPISCRIGNQTLTHVALPGNTAILPADTEFHGETRESIDLLMLSIPKHSLACFSAEHARPNAALNAKLSGCDAPLLAAARELADEASAGFSSGPAYWSELTDALFSGLLQNHLLAEPCAARTTLGPDAMTRINAYVAAHLGEPIEVDTIADVAGRQRSYFPRIFRRAVGMSPYQYLVQLRLKHAIRMFRDPQLSFADVAAATGFADQSHLCRWVKRVYGVSPTRFTKPLRRGAAN